MNKTMEHKDYRLAAIMYTDICGFSRMMEKNEQETLEMLSYHNKLLHEKSREYNGTVIKTVGDAFLVDFKNTFDAVKCAIQIQHELGSFNSTKQGDKLVLRIGVHLGDIYFFETDALGEGINIASRLQSLAKPGRICISKEVYNMVSNKIDTRVIPIGKVDLKNITRDIYAYEIIPETSMDYSDLEREQEREEYRYSGRTAPEPPQPQEPISFRDIKDMVVREIKDAGRRIKEENLKDKFRNYSHTAGHRSHHFEHFDSVLDKLARKGFVVKLEQDDGRVSYGLSGEGEQREAKKGNKENGDPYATFRRYKEIVITRAEKERAGVIGHIVPFVVVNAGLFFLWKFFTPDAIQWFLFPLGGWGIGLVSHIASVSGRQRERRTIEALPELDTVQLGIFRRIQRSLRSFRSHLVSNIAVMVFLYMINMLTSPQFPWFWFPVGGMALGIFFHWMGHIGNVRRLKRDFNKKVFGKEGVFSFTRQSGTQAPAAAAYPSDDPVVRQAFALKDTLTSQIKSLGAENNLLGEDMLPVLDNYVNQIAELSRKNRELESIIGSIPIRDLEQDRARLAAKTESAEGEYIKKEYQKSITEIDGQLKSFRALKDQKEVIELRVISAVNSLKQMQIDLARMKSLSTVTDISSMSILKDKSQELSQYLEDLHKGYDELDNLS